MKLENLLLKRTGGCGRYQLLLTLIIHSMKCSVCFTMLFMVFGTASSDWWCIEDLDDSNMTFTSELQQYQSCQPFNSSQTCTKFYFDESQVTTVITEWSLVCNKEWIKSTITSIQMAGVLIGNLVCGQVADVIGRKPPLFISIATLVVFNIVAAFSTSWIMFAAIRFCLGVGMGLYLADQHSLLSEFTIPKWRTLIEAIPTWSIQTVLLSLVAWLLKNWRYLHFATAAIGFPFVFTYWFVPESVEWYVSRNRLSDAVNVIKKVAEVNQSSIDTPELKTITKDIGRKMLTDRKYSYKYIIRNGSLFLNTLLLVIVWFSNGLGTYGVQFGIPELSGNLYINIFIMALISCPLQFICVYLTNRIGKKISAIFFYTICGVSALIVAITYRLEETEVTKSVINIAAIVCLIGIYVASMVVHSLTLETYPKVIRNVGYGFQNTMARIGAIFGPQLVYLDSKFAGTLYWISGISAVISLFIILPLPGTINKKLSDTNNEREREETEEPDLSIEIIDENQTKNEAV